MLESGSNGEWLSTGDIDDDGDQDVCLFLKNPKEADRDLNRVAWLENPGTLEGQWKSHVIGLTNYHGDKVIPADVNGDGRLDLVVTEERWPGLDPDAGMYWFEAPENPVQWNWNRHHIVTQYSMNNLDVADLDMDGDPDIVTCEHKGPAEQLQVWENDGNGNFIHTSLTKERKAMPVQDWRTLTGMVTWTLSALRGTISNISMSGETMPYWMVGMAGPKLYRLDLERKGIFAISSPYPSPLQKRILPIKSLRLSWTLRSLIKKSMISRTIDAGSVRVFETDEAGEIIDENVFYQYERDPDNARLGKLVFKVSGWMARWVIQDFLRS